MVYWNKIYFPLNKTRNNDFFLWGKWFIMPTRSIYHNLCQPRYINSDALLLQHQLSTGKPRFMTLPSITININNTDQLSHIMLLQQVCVPLFRQPGEKIPQSISLVQHATPLLWQPGVRMLGLDCIQTFVKKNYTGLCFPSA